MEENGIILEWTTYSDSKAANSGLSNRSLFHSKFASLRTLDRPISVERHVGRGAPQGQRTTGPPEGFGGTISDETQTR